MNAAYVYLQLYRMFENVTPLCADCGTLCDSACCKGNDCGMYLFPGEKKVFELLNCTWSEIDTAEFTYVHDNKTKNIPILFCNGTCDRFQRPLACRIFPLTPYLDGDKVLKVIIDPRAKSVCPLSTNIEINDFNHDFVKNVERTFQILLNNKEFYSFMIAYSAYIDEYLKFFN